MSSPRYDWWSYAKGMLRRYPNKCNQNEKIAIEKAIEITRQLDTGEERIRLADMVFFKKSHTMEGAGAVLYISPRTAQRWHADFIREVGRNFSCNSLIEDSSEIRDLELPRRPEPRALESNALEKLNARHLEIIALMSEFDMHQTNVGRALGITQGSVASHLKTIKRRTGVDPNTFWGLVALDESIRKENTDVH